MIPIFLIAFVGLLVLFWYDSMRAKEIAIDTSRNMCERHGLQLLDDTVAIKHISLARDEIGKLRIERGYSFEYCDEESNRKIGLIKLCGVLVTEITRQSENNNVIHVDFNKRNGD